MTPIPELAALVADLDTLARGGGGGYWHLKAIRLSVLDALPSVLEAVRAEGPRARFEVIDGALRAACDALPRLWKEAAFDHLGLSEAACQQPSLTERQKMAAKQLHVDETGYRRVKKRADGTYVLWRDDRFPSWSVKTLTLVAEELMFQEYRVDVRSWSLADVPPVREETDEPSVREGKGDGVGLAYGSVRDHHIELFRVDQGRVEHRWYSDDEGWSEWVDFTFQRPSRDVTAVSAWRDHLEVFILTRDGTVWRRDWWLDREPRWGTFDYLGRPFGRATRAIAAASLRDGHIDVQVEAVDGTMRNNWFTNDRWHFPKDAPSWQE